MTELLNELVKVPLLALVIFVLIIIGCMILAQFVDRYDKNHYGKNHYGKNPYLIAIISLLCLELLMIVGGTIYSEIVKSNVYEYVTIKKENDTINVKSHSIFVESKTFKIKETVNDITIVEYNGKEFVIRNQQLQ